MPPLSFAFAIVILAALLFLVFWTVRRDKEAQTAVSSAQDKQAQALAQLQEAREELRAATARLDERERRINAREDHCDRTEDELREQRATLDHERAMISQQAQDLEARHQQVTAELERVAGLSSEQAEAEVMSAVKEKAHARAYHLAKSIEETATADAQRRARRIIATAIERLAVTQTAESVVSAVDLPSEEMKGRIIGREGRNIRAFEQVSGVTVLIDDTPGSVLLSSFDPVRREIARLTLESLVSDGRIHPVAIEEAHAAATQEVAEACLTAADDAIEAAGIVGLSEELRPHIGALAYRTSYGQNVLAHCLECAMLAGAMASELGLDIQTCKKAAFLHDIGKAVVTNGEGSHALEGAELVRKAGEDEAIVHAIAAHHNEIPVETVEDILTQAADAISGSRPGARRESVEAYVERLEKLEEIATAKPGVERAFAMQAGREIRVMVMPDQVDDEQSHMLAQEIASEVESTVVYPGRIKVTVIRESRATATAH